MIGIVAYGVGNIGSLTNAFAHLGVDAFVAQSPEDVARADKLLLPGVGAFGRAMELLEAADLRGPLDEAVLDRGVPLLGICVGMQLLADLGTEFGDTPGLGYVPGRVVRIDAPSLRLPQIGWNEVHAVRDCPLLDGLEGGRTCYFVHSYHLVPEDRGHLVATCDYGTEVTAVVQAGHVFGAQFHPEKSQDCGLRVLGNFARA